MATDKTKKTILLDLDRVLNNNQGDYDEDFIPEPKEGAEEFMKKLSEKYNVKIFTSRNIIPTSIWLINNNLSQYITGITTIIEPAHLIIDDRCICFDENFDNILENIEHFQV